MDDTTSDEDSDDDYSFEESDESSHDSIIDEMFEEENLCDNCIREGSKTLIDEYGSLYQLEFTLASRDEIRKRRKFKFVKSTNNTNERWYCLCHDCHSHLVTLDDSKEANEARYIFPSFIWSILSDVDLQCHYGLFLWEFIPKPWHYWWLNSARSFDCF